MLGLKGRNIHEFEYMLVNWSIKITLCFCVSFLDVKVVD